MSSKLEPQNLFQDCSSGVITGVASSIVPPNSVPHAVNMVFDEMYGSPMTRLGTTLVGAQVVAESNTILGLYNYIDSEAGANSQLITTVNAVSDGSAVTYYLNAGTWTSTLTGDTANLKTRYFTFLDYVVRLNGTDACKAWSGTGAWSSTTAALDLANMPVGKFGCVFKAQVVIAGVAGDPDAIRISSVVNAGGTAISWSTGDRTIRINPMDSSNITGLGEIGGLLIIFKRFAFYRFNNRSTDADVVCDVGCSSNESIAVGGDQMFFFNENGVWMTQGAYPIRISRRVQRWIDGMSASFYENVAGACDGKYYFCSIGDVTLDDGSTYSNVVLRYTIDTKEWAVFSYAHNFRVFASYVNSGAVQLLGGDTTARVLQLNAGLTDNGTAIDFTVESHEQVFGSRGIVKEVTERIMAYGLNPPAARLRGRI